MSGKVVIVVGVLFSILLLGSALALELALRAARRAQEPASEKPAEVSRGQPSEEKKQEEKRADRDAIGRLDEPNPADLDKMVKDYMAASQEDKLRFVMDPERVRSLMEASASTARGSKPFSITTQFLGKRTDPVEWYLVRASGQTTLGVHSSADFPFRRTSKGFKIDWEAFVGYNPTPLKVFMAERPETASVFRVQCELADYYNYAFSEAKDTHISVSLLENNPRASAHGYVSKDSPDGKRLRQLLRDGHRHNLTLELRHVGPDGNPIVRAGSGIVSITRLMGESWVRK